MNFTLANKLYLSSAGLMVMFIVLATVNILSYRQTNHDFEEVLDHTVVPLMNIQFIERDLLEIRFRIAGVALDQLPPAGASVHLRETQEAIDQHWSEFLSKNLATDPEEVELVDQLKSGFKDLKKLFNKVDQLYRNEDKNGLEDFLNEDWPPVTTSVLKPLARVVAIQETQMRETQTLSLANGSRRLTITMSLFAFATVFLLIITFFLIRSIRGPIDGIRKVLSDVANNDFSVRAEIKGNDEISAIAHSVNQTLESLLQTLTEVRSSADSLSQGAIGLSGESADARAQTTALTDQVMQISAAMQQLTVSIAEVSERAVLVADASSETRAIAREGERVVSDNVASTHRALQSVSSSSAAVGELSEAINEISAVTNVIKEIADQTNLLALNAAIEAARAGEQGRGFAVVADEVRKLAERTSLSTKNIGRMIETVQGKTGAAITAMNEVSRDVENGSKQAEQLTASFDKIVSAMDQLSRLSEEIADGAREQSKVAQQTAQNMEMMSGVSERTNAMVSLVASTANDSVTTAERLKASVKRFRLN